MDFSKGGVRVVSDDLALRSRNARAYGIALLFIILSFAVSKFVGEIRGLDEGGVARLITANLLIGGLLLLAWVLGSRAVQKYSRGAGAALCAGLLLAFSCWDTWRHTYISQEDVKTFVEMRTQQLNYYDASTKMWSAFHEVNEALQKAAAAQPEDGAPLIPTIQRLIDENKSVLEKYAQAAEAEFKEWDAFEVRHFTGKTLATRRSINAFHVALIRDAVQTARGSAQLAFADIPTGPNSAVLVRAAAFDFGRISTFQVEARASREREFMKSIE